MGRICNRPEIFETIIKYFGLIDGQLHRRYKHRDEWRRIPGVMRKDYLAARVSHAHVCVHHMVMVLKTQSPIPEGMVVDHIDGDIRNNRADNLRVVTIQVNSQNRGAGKNSTTGRVCVMPQPCGTFRVNYRVNRKNIHVGHFATIEDAIAARDKSFLEHCPERYHAVKRRCA